MLDEMDRALHDALSIVKRTLESNTVSLHSLPLDPIWGQLSCPMKTNKFFMRMEFTK
jgi:hypothetical protein